MNRSDEKKDEKRLHEITRKKRARRQKGRMEIVRK